jgi:ketosteroid isomerase-like protein
MIMADATALTNEVEAFYRAFIDGFNREDTDMYLRSFCYPNGILSGERGMAINAKESDQQRFYQEVMSSIQERGWDHTGVNRLQVWPIAENMAFLVADISRYKKDNSVLESGRYCYTVRKDDGAWKVLTLTEVKPPFSGPGERRP